MPPLSGNVDEGSECFRNVGFLLRVDATRPQRKIGLFLVCVNV
jgi:hypothetical protein